MVKGTNLQGILPRWYPSIDQTKFWENTGVFQIE